ncbi:BatD family protein [Pseudomonas sp. LS44]|uniref:BatD family protein n=1 Tax=Pseudomonas sp. LS44 TaxID=1357074 RepID=UPI00215A4592|nr:BatD family protein [Pseudomonas sp. LS44]UVE16048.1 BatD family protein [Pseudomonas sp. LS44]
MKRLLLLLCCLCPLLGLAAPKVLVESRIAPAGTVTVGSTVRLEVDVLVDTWFTDAPQLPNLDLPGAMVMPPSSEATHLTEQRQGEKLFGLRFSYLITPNQAQSYSIPALSIQVSPGQGSGPVTVQSQPLGFIARLPAGVPAGQQVLVAQGLRFDQQIVHSHEPLRVGDSLTRQLTIEADGAQAMLIPPPEFVEIDGLKRYVKTPQVVPLDNGRGAISGGRRVDVASYVVDQPGHYTLPAIELRWWDAAANQARTARVPAVEFEATANSAYQAPFSIAEDLQKLGQKARVRIARHWLLLVIALVVGALAFYWGKPWWRRGRAALRGWQARRQQTYLQSADYAWKQLPGQLNGKPAQLTALYLWARRSQGAQTLKNFATQLPIPLAQRLLVLLKSCYGRPERATEALQELQQSLPALRKEARKQQPHALARHGLVPLNPRQAPPPSAAYSTKEAL